MNVINLKINDKDIQCNMGILAVRKYCESYNIDLDKLGKAMQKQGVFAVTDLIYFAHVAHCNLKGEDLKVTKEDCTEAIEYLSEETISLIMDSIMGIKILGKKIGDAGNATKKKAVNSKK